MNDDERGFLPRGRTAALLAGVVALLIPALAYAVPGSGNFVAVDSTGGQQITYLYNVIAKICLGILIVVEGVLFYAIFKFRRQSEDEQPEPVHGHLPLEVTWTLAALAIQIFIGWKSVDVMFDVETPPKTQDKIVIEAVARQWDWTFKYRDFAGKYAKYEKILGNSTLTAQNLVIPANAQIQLNVTSKDVLHAIFIPELGVKIDAVPGRFNYWWFTAAGPNSQAKATGNGTASTEDERPTTRSSLGRFLTSLGSGMPVPGRADETRVDYLGGLDVPEKSPYAEYDAVEYMGMCAELCGKGHWNMYFRTVSMTRSSFEQWLRDKLAESQSGDVDGASVYANRCKQCHGKNGKGSGSFPPLAGSPWATKNTDENKRRHIEVVLQGSNSPAIKKRGGQVKIGGKVYGQAAQMPGHTMLNDAQVKAVVNHERTSWGNQGGEVSLEMVQKVRKDKLGLKLKPPKKPGEMAAADLRALGKKLYASCEGCHGSDGKGPGDVPNLEGNSTVLSDPKGLVDLLDEGRDSDKWPGRQPPSGQTFSNKELAAVLTYIRQSWGNDASAVQPPAVGEIRKQMESD